MEPSTGRPEGIPSSLPPFRGEDKLVPEPCGGQKGSGGRGSLLRAEDSGRGGEPRATELIRGQGVYVEIRPIEECFCGRWPWKPVRGYGAEPQV